MIAAAVSKLMADPVTLVVGKPDVVLAAEFRAELTPHLNKAAEIIDRARLAGISINFNIAADNFGRISLREINVVKPL